MLKLWKTLSFYPGSISALSRPSPRWCIVLIFTGLLLSAPAKAKNFSTITYLPETERPFDVCVIGLPTNSLSYSFLPSLKKKPSMKRDEWSYIQKQLYWLDFERIHGRIIEALPRHTKLYIAIPDPQKVKDSLGNENKLFVAYLKEYCHWSKDEIDMRVHFFKCDTPLVWSQDIGKILGEDEHGRWVIFRSPKDDLDRFSEPYRQTIKALCEAYPDHFTFKDLPDGVTAQGGDEDLVRTPDGHLLFLVGRHRAVYYNQWIHQLPSDDQTMDSDQIAAAQNAYSAGFDALPVAFMPKAVLKDPTLGNNELFHLDMVTAVVGIAGQQRAFVPTYISPSVDCGTGQALAPDFVDSLQKELDLVASEMEGLGFPVVRLPETDHPARSPVNIVRFFNRETGRCTVLLSKYPRCLGDAYPQTPQAEYGQSLDQLREAATAWQDKTDDAHYQRLKGAISNVWEKADQEANEDNPQYDAIADTIQKAGIDVVPVPDHPWGAGGIHCETLH